MKASHWAVRLTHEAKLHDEKCFLTLTFRDECLPSDYSVRVIDLQLFMKRLRAHIAPRKVRFFACGEYGDAGGRPHYHLILFGYEFPDITPWRKTASGFVTYRSAQLEKLWPYGHCEIGTVTVKSAGYCARYITKKIGGELADSHYTRVHPITGEVVKVSPEFIVMSNKPGIGSGWFDKYKDDAFPSDFVIIEGEKRPIPPYYKKKLSEREALRVTQQRKEAAKKHADNNTDRRLMTREESLHLKVQRLKREMESEG